MMSIIIIIIIIIIIFIISISIITICVSTHQEGAEEDEGDKIQIGELAPTQGARFLVFR